MGILEQYAERHKNKEMWASPIPNVRCRCPCHARTVCKFSNPCRNNVSDEFGMPNSMAHRHISYIDTMPLSSPWWGLVVGLVYEATQCPVGFETVSVSKGYIVVSVKITSMINSLAINNVFEPNRTLGSLISNPKDKTPPDDKNGIVHSSMSSM